MAANEPKGKGGWLGLLIFQLLTGPLWLLGRESSDIHAAESQGAIWPDGFKTMYFGSILVTGAIMVYAGYLLWTGKTRQEPLDALKFMWGGMAAMIAAPAWVASTYLPGADIGGGVVIQIFTACFWGLIWTLYIAKSKRVRNTYAAVDAVSPETQAARRAMGYDDAASVNQLPEDWLQPKAPVVTAATAAPAVPANAQFTLFCAKADDKWYWVFKDDRKVLARGSTGYDSRAECIASLKAVRQSAGAAWIWDQTANEFVS